MKNIIKIKNEFSGISTDNILEKAVLIFENKIVFASSFSVEDQIITHLISKLKLKIEIFTLDTGRLFNETYDIIERTEDKYNLKIKIYTPNTEDLETMVNTRGINLFYTSIENRKECCNVRKVKPLQRALKGSLAWICGLRKSHSANRKNNDLVAWDTANNIYKLNPLIDWNDEQVMGFIKENKIPYNKLFDHGFLSIGCAPCTRAIKSGEDVRAGRWWWELDDHKECGLHK